MKRFLLLMIICLAFVGSLLTAHNARFDNEDPSDYDYNRYFVETAPPVAPVRPVAEFEPATQALIRYPLGIPVNLVAQLSNVAQVVCLVGSASTQTQASNFFQSGGVNMDNVSFLIAPTDTYWTRDYGPFFIFDGNNELGIVDFPYNRPRPNDDEIPRTFAFTYDYPLYGMNITDTGGNYMGDSVNGAAQTTLVYTENSSQTQTQIAQKMYDYMGVENYNVVADPNGDYIEHIDCWGKFLAPDKILIRSVPTSHSQYNQIEATANYFSTHNCAWGYPYKVYRVYTPQNQPYTNSLILNNNVFVPTMNSTYDSDALQVYQDALPGYNIIGITGAGNAPWQSTDALHCRVHEIPDRDMLYIHHMPYHELTNLQDFYDFNASIIPYSNQAVIDDSLLLVYKVNQGQWQDLVLTNTIDNYYSTLLINLVPGDTVRYFIHAADLSGHSVNHPLTGALDPHIFWVTPDNIPPVIVHVPITSITADQFPVSLSATVTDNYGVNHVQLIYKFDDNDENILELETSAGNDWTILFNPDIPAGATHLYYKIAAFDNSHPANISYAPAQDWYDAEIITVSADDNTLPSIAFSLDRIYPNPFILGRGTDLSIAYSSKAGNHVKFCLYNTKGQLLQTDETVAKANGNQSYLLSLSALKANSLSSGIYYLQVISNEKVAAAKLLILK